MIPLRHTVPSLKKPVVNHIFVAANVAVFIIQVFMGPAAETVIQTFGFIPNRFLNPTGFGYSRWEVSLTLVTSLFLHGGFVHLFGNMIYLWTFGDAVEEALGHARYFFCYLAWGAIGSLTHTLLFPRSPIASIGASGCIAGVLGAFLVLKPHAKIVTLFPLIIYWAMAEIPGIVFLPLWFVMQFFNGFLSLAAARGTQEVAGIAWWAHVGGFICGALVAVAVRMTSKPPRVAVGAVDRKE